MLPLNCFPPYAILIDFPFEWLNGGFKTKRSTCFAMKSENAFL